MIIQPVSKSGNKIYEVHTRLVLASPFDEFLFLQEKDAYGILSTILKLIGGGFNKHELSTTISLKREAKKEAGIDILGEPQPLCVIDDTRETPSAIVHFFRILQNQISRDQWPQQGPVHGEWPKDGEGKVTHAFHYMKLQEVEERARFDSKYQFKIYPGTVAGIVTFAKYQPELFDEKRKTLDEDIIREIKKATGHRVSDDLRVSFRLPQAQHSLVAKRAEEHTEFTPPYLHSFMLALVRTDKFWYQQEISYLIGLDIEATKANWEKAEVGATYDAVEDPALTQANRMAAAAGFAGRDTYMSSNLEAICKGPLFERYIPKY